jgi:tetratricopeptide (TPR) repeat protein
MHSERTVAAAMLLALTLAPLVPRAAEAQSAWARGDQAFKAKRWAEAESLYARRLRRGAPDDVRVNLATARALKGDAARGESDLARLADREGRSGLAAGYNVGTLRGGRNEFDPALAALRQVLERDPNDEDARWNYEVLMRRRERQRPNDPNQPPQPKPQSGGGGGNAPQQPTQGMPNLPQPAGSPPPRPSGQRQGRMDRAEAERLLGALEELSRTQQQRQRKVPVTPTDRRGRDW